jgi:hypothetical protein
MEFSQCTQNNIAICSADAAVYSTQVITCASSLFLQKQDTLNLCRRKLLLHRFTPLLHCHHSAWVYHLPDDQHIILRCWENGTWISTTRQLKGNGIIHGSSNCLLTADKFQAFPRITGVFQTAIDTAKVYVPDQLAVITSHELRTLEDNIPSEIAQLNFIKSQLATSHGMDMTSFLRESEATRRHYEHASQCLTTFIILSTIVALALATYLLKTYWYQIISCFLIKKRTPDLTTPQSNPVNENPSTSGEINTRDTHVSDKTVPFSLYELQHDA